MIPKPSGGERQLGIPTVMDRLIQQALHQVLSPIYDSTFSDNSYGFRPGRSAHQALLQAQAYINEDKRWVVDVDLSKFFDEVNHARLLAKLRRRIADKRVIHLIDRYLRIGMLANGIVEPRAKGTPQGSPLSPLLSNIVLDELDKELEDRGLRFVRYADDFQIYVGTRRSADRVMKSISKFIENKLKLKVNMTKSEVGRPWDRTFLGYSFTMDKQVRLKPGKVSIVRFRNKVKMKFRHGKGRNIGNFILEDLNPVIQGWAMYFSLSETKEWMAPLDSWLRRRLRKVKWQQWKRNWTRFEGLLKRGLAEEHAVRSAFNRLGPWFNSGASHMNQAFPKSYYDKIGLVTVAGTINKRRADRRSKGTAVIRNRTSGGVRGPR
jgi:RNA-directed DNA polymerase